MSKATDNRIGKRKMYNLQLDKKQMINLSSYLSMIEEDCKNFEAKSEVKSVKKLSAKVQEALDSDEIIIPLTGWYCHEINRALEHMSLDEDKFIDQQDERAFGKLRRFFYRQWHGQDKNMNKNWMKPDEQDRQDKIAEARRDAHTINGKTRYEFIRWLETTLIPDLKESGSTCTAEDFETCIKFMR